MKKQIFVILLIVCMLLVFCGCKETPVSSSSLSAAASDISKQSSELTTSQSSEISTTSVSSTQSLNNFSSNKISSRIASNYSTSSRLSNLAGRYEFFAEGKSSHTMVAGETKLFGTPIPLLPPGGFSASYSYKISDETIIRLARDEEGREIKGQFGCTVEALKPGTATLTGTWRESGETVSKSCTITVLSDFPDSMKSVCFIDKNAKINIDETKGIEFIYEHFFSKEDTDYVQPEFKISDETIAQVFSYEKKEVSHLISFFDVVYIDALRPGTTTLTVTAYDNGKAFTDTCTIIVEDITKEPSIGIASSFLSSN